MMGLTIYEANVVQAFRDVCDRNKDSGNPGASPDEVCRLLHERGQMPRMDSVLDLVDTMRKLSSSGALYEKDEGP